MRNKQFKAVSMSVLLSDGSRKELKNFWEEKPLVLVFLRHFGWPFCREQVAQLRQTKNRFDEYNAQILIVGSGNRKQAETFRQTYAPEFVVASDSRRRLYQAYQLKRTSLFQMSSPSLFLKGIKTIARGHGIGSPQGDVFQLPGVFIIDTKGMVRYGHHGRDPSDRPEPEALLSVLAEIQ